jgi:DNA polymerase-4
MDAFYASVEIRDAPALLGKPVIVGGAPQGRGVVAAASYAARKFGVHAAMPMAQALRLCPHAVLIRPRIDYYAVISQQIRAIFARFTPEIEPLSLDEAFLDVTASERLFGSGEQIARAIKQAVHTDLQLVASVGVAPTKFVAKIASDIHKPDALVVVPAQQVHAFLDPLPVSRLWGAGKATVAQFEKLGVRTIGQVRQLPAALLVTHFGQCRASIPARLKVIPKPNPFHMKPPLRWISAQPRYWRDGCCI